MKQLVIILITIIMTGFPVCMQAQYSATDRQPFSGNNYPMQRAPGVGLPNDNASGGPFLGGGTGGGGPWDELPNGNEGGGGWVGMPVKDTYWFLSLIAIGYGIIRRKKKHADYTE